MPANQWACQCVSDIREKMMGLKRYPLRDALPIRSTLKRHLKKHMTRWMRRWAKRDPASAPKKKYYKGWYW
jgi:hypothetical protein